MVVEVTLDVFTDAVIVVLVADGDTVDDATPRVNDDWNRRVSIRNTANGVEWKVGMLLHNELRESDRVNR